MTSLKYFLAIFAVASWYVAAFLKYPLPTVSFWLLWAEFACWVPLSFFSLGALFRRDWGSLAIFSTAWLVASYCIYEPQLEPARVRDWLAVQGLRIHVAPVERYLAGCKLIAFMDDGIEQQLSYCETIVRSSEDWEEIFHDTTGQFALPPRQRTQAWQDAMHNLNSSYCYLTEKAVADPLFGNFYAVVISIEHVGGC